MVALAFVCAACSGPPVASSVSLIANPNPAVPLAAVLELTSDRPVLVTLSIADGSHEQTVTTSRQPATHHEIPVLGLRPDRTHTVTASITDESGRTTVLAPLEIATPPLPDEFPPIELKVRQPEAMEPGVTMLHYFRWISPMEDDPDWGLAAAVDDSGEVIWYYLADHAIDELKRLPNGDLFYASDNGMYEIDMLGNVKRRWHTSYAPPDKIGDASVLIPTDTFHHEVIYLPERGTFLALGLESREYDNFPLEYPPGEKRGTDRVSADEIIEFTPDGQVVTRISALDILDPKRLGYGSLGRDFYDHVYEGVYDPMPVDLMHSNALAWLPGESSVVVSSNFQGVLYKVDLETGTLSWLLGDPTGWNPPWSEKLLTPKGDVGWSYHQHGVDLTPHGTLLLFDNGGDRAIPPNPVMPPEERYSRAVEYRVDDAAGTVEEVWSYGPQQERFISPFISDADLLVETGNVLITDGGRFAGPDGEMLATFGARHWARVLEVTYDGKEKVWEVDSNDPARHFSIYRAQRLLSLYPEFDRLPPAPSRTR